MEEGRQVGDVAGGHVAQQQVGHEGFLLRDQQGDVAGRDANQLVLLVLERDRVGGLFDQQPVWMRPASVSTT